MLFRVISIRYLDKFQLEINNRKVNINKKAYLSKFRYYLIWFFNLGKVVRHSTGTISKRANPNFLSQGWKITSSSL